MKMSLEYVVELPVLLHLRRVISGLLAAGNDHVQEFDSTNVGEKLVYLLMMIVTLC